MRPVRRSVGVVILAAGKGTRMRSRLPKVAHQVAGRAMLEHVLRAASAALTITEGPSADAEGDSTGGQTAYADAWAIVVGHEREQVREAIHFTPLGGAPHWILQEPQLGTGDAVRAVHETLTGLPTPPETILVLYGDTPLVRAETLRALLAEHERTNATLTFLTGIVDRPTDYGRVIRDEQGRIAGIVEARHATPEQLALPEVNSGIYCFQADWLWLRLDRLEPHENGEYYLTDLIAVAVREGAPLATVSGSIEETGGANDRVQLAEAARVLRERILRELMLSGVTIEDPANTYIDAGVRVGQDTIIRPGTTISGATVIGERCVIGPQSVIRDSQIGDGCLALASWVEEAVMEPGSRVGPMSHLRPGARLTSGANVGNFAEIKNATLGADVQMHHFSYIGDASIGARTNVAAGVITSNFSADGKKYRTKVGEDVFLGSDSQLVAPISIGDYAMIGGGSVVRRDVPPGGVAVGIPARVIKHRQKPQLEQPAEQTQDAHEAAAQDTIEGMNATDRTATDRARE
jgi:bifunctional UDP-N-acetylglucosamine pyrophosphorylase / glucosamine-1-phosphate N-acetyltransferase